MLWWKLQRLKSRMPVRRRMLDEMVATGDPAVVEPLAEALKDEAPEVRVAAVRVW